MKLVTRIRSYVTLFIAGCLVSQPGSAAMYSDAQIQESVCVADASAALTKALEYHQRIGRQIANEKGREPYYFRAQWTIEEFTNSIPGYLTAVPSSALVLYAADAKHKKMCAFLWTGESAPIYAMVDATLDEVANLATEINGSIVADSRSGDEIAAKKLAAFRNIAKGKQTANDPGPGRPAIPVGLFILDEKNRAGDRSMAIGRLSEILFPAAFHKVLGSTKQPVKHVTIVPIGAMSSLPTALLRPAGDRREVIDLFSVNYLLFAGETRRGAVPWTGKFEKPLIFANPRGKDAFWTLSDINESAEEARKVRKVFKKAKLLEGSNAKIGDYYAKAGQADLLYFAAHAIAGDRDPLRESYIALADGNLTAAMVGNKDISAKLVVMSACQTGLGHVTDGGIVGLGRTFLDAGARNAIMSLWNVNDQTTRYLMSKFVELLSDHGPAEALRRAQMYTRSKYPKPVYWAPFAVYGNHVAIGKAHN